MPTTRTKKKKCIVPMVDDVWQAPDGSLLVIVDFASSYICADPITRERLGMRQASDFKEGLLLYRDNRFVFEKKGKYFGIGADRNVVELQVSFT